MKLGLEQTCVVMRRHFPRFKCLSFVHLPIINNKYHDHFFQLHNETAPITYHGDVYVMTRKLPIGVVRLYVKHKVHQRLLRNRSNCHFFSLAFCTLPFIRRCTSQPRISFYFLHFKFFQLLTRFIFIH